jgi:FAD/FMN-containing dehydrogenase
MRTLDSIILREGAEFRPHPQAGPGVPTDQPVAIAVPRTADEVRAVVAHAAERDWRVAVHTTGRGVRQTGSLQETLLVRTGELDAVRLDAPARVARLGGGARWLDVSRAAAPAGLAAVSITTPTVGVAGTILAGGTGWLGRRHGLACESVRAVELVTGDGDLLRADANRERDLFWALRGGGGGLGVITALELALVAPATLQAGHLGWPGARAEEVLHAWREWTATLPREVTSIARLIGGDHEPRVYVEAVALLEAAVSGALLAPLRALGPEEDTFAAVGPAALDTLHFDVLGERPVYYDHLMLDDLPAEALDAFLELAGPGAGFPLLDVELRQLGGALNDRTRQSGALGSLDAEYGIVVAADPAAAATARELCDAVSPWAAGHIFVSFLGQSSVTDDVFTTDALRRLQAVKALYDPSDRFLWPL